MLKAQDIDREDIWIILQYLQGRRATNRTVNDLLMQSHLTTVAAIDKARRA